MRGGGCICTLVFAWTEGDWNGRKQMGGDEEL